MDKKIQIRLRTPSGQERLEVSEDGRLVDLLRVIKEKTNLADFTLKYGYPLKSLDISLDAQEQTIRDLKLRGETIVLVPAEAPAPVAVAETKPKFTPKGIEPDETTVEWSERGGYLGMYPSLPRGPIFDSLFSQSSV